MPSAAIRATPGHISARRAFTWWISGLRLWARAPIRLAIVCWLPIFAEAIIQLIPLAGTPLSKVAVALLGNGLWLLFDRISSTGQFAWRDLLWSFERKNRGRALLLAFIMASIFVLQVLLVTMIYGLPALDAVVFGHLREHPELYNQVFVLVLILPGLLPSTLLMFATPLVVLDAMKPIEAARESVLVLLASPGALAAVLAVTVALIAIALLWGYGLLFLPFAPWFGLMAYCAYRDVFGAPATPHP
ncbi:MAG TPA: hypothetical protein VH040_12440 [Usitatibacter sp.]|nr:hypothetical protein [Usitatibacter sp.]